MYLIRLLFHVQLFAIKAILEYKMLEYLQFLSHVTQVWYIEVAYQIVMNSNLS